jgi:hypothetical protein
METPKGSLCCKTMEVEQTHIPRVLILRARGQIPFAWVQYDERMFSFCLSLFSREDLDMEREERVRE